MVAAVVPAAGAQTTAPDGAPSIPPIRMVAATSPGGVTDLLARMAAAGLGSLLGQIVVVDNRAGAAGNVAAELVARSPADGHTLLMISSGNIVIAPYLYRLPFDPISDLVPLFNMADARICSSCRSRCRSGICVNSSRSRRRVREDQLRLGGFPAPAPVRRSLRACREVAQLVHVPYKGAWGPRSPISLAGRCNDDDDARLGAAAVPERRSKAARRVVEAAAGAYPDIPTSEEAGLPGWQMTTWFGVFAPRWNRPQDRHLTSTPGCNP
jgi:hypothetical protein